MLRVGLRAAMRLAPQVSARWASDGKLTPTWSARVRLRVMGKLHKLFLQDEDMIQERNKQNEAETAVLFKTMPKAPLPNFEGMDITSLLNFYETKVDKASTSDDYEVLMQFYQSLNSRITKLNKAELLRFLSLSVLDKSLIQHHMLKANRESEQEYQAHNFTYSERHKQIAFEAERAMDYNIAMMRHIAKELKTGLLKSWFPKKHDDSQEIAPGDILPSRSVVFQNIERIIGRMYDKDPKACARKDLLCILLAFGAAQEGTDSLYELLGEKLLPYFREFDIVDIEGYLNFFPHSLWLAGGLMKYNPILLRGCYQSLITRLQELLPKAPPTLFCSLFQGFCAVPSALGVFSPTLNAFLVQFMTRLQNKIFSVDELIKFLELLCLHLENNKTVGSQIDETLVAKSVWLLFLTKIQLASLNISQLTSFVWIMHRLNGTESIEPLFGAVLKQLKAADIPKATPSVLAELLGHLKLLEHVASVRAKHHESAIKSTLAQIQNLAYTKDV